MLGAAALAVLLAVPRHCPCAPGHGGRAAGIELASQPAWSAWAAPRARPRRRGRPAGLDLRVLLHGRHSRIGFDETVSGRAWARSSTGPRSRSTDSRSTATAAARPRGRCAAPPAPIRRPACPPACRRDARGAVDGRVPVGGRGCDTRSDHVLDRFVTYLVAVDAPAGGPAIGEPLRVSWLWRLEERPVLRPDGAPDPAAVRSLSERGRLDTLSRTLAADDLPVTIAPLPALVDGWAGLAADDPAVRGGLSALRRAAETHEVISGPWVPVDVASLERVGLGAQVADLIARGPDTLSTVLGLRVDTRLAYRDRLDSATLARLRESGTDRLIVAPDALVPVSHKLTPAQPFSLVSEGRTFLAAQTDPGLASLATRDAPPALQAQRLLAGLAVVALELPGVRRGVVVPMPEDWDPDPAIVAALRDGLAANPLVRMVSANELFDGVPAEETDRGTVVQRDVQPARPAAPSGVGGPIPTVQGHLDAFAAWWAVTTRGSRPADGRCGRASRRAGPAPRGGPRPARTSTASTPRSPRSSSRSAPPPTGPSRSPRGGPRSRSPSSTRRSGRSA